MPEVSYRQGRDNIPPPMAPAAMSNPFLNPIFMDHIVRVVAA
jgi:hypothetical protein